MTASTTTIKYGVRIDEKRFPATKILYKRLLGLSYKFKHPPQDALQECMLLEVQATRMVNRGEMRREKIAGYVMFSMYKYLIAHSKKAKREPTYDEIYDGTFIKCDRRKIGIRLALKETLDLLEKIDLVTAGIFENALTEQVNWHILYQRHYRGFIGRNEYWKRVWQIQLTAQATIEMFKKHMKF